MLRVWSGFPRACPFRVVPPPASCGEERHIIALLRCKPPSPIRETGQDHCHTGPWSREAVLSRHTSTALSMAAASASATALGICGGFRLYTLRRAQPLSMCRHTGAGHSCHRFRLHDRRASCPFSGAVRRSRLPGIVSFHRHSPHGGCDPPPSLSGGFQPAAYCTQ